MTMEWPSLSIIMPTLNQGKFIERAILSVLKQNYEGELQFIVADGGSTDGTVEILKKYPQIIWWSKPDKGVLDAIFQSLKIATGELIATLPSDDFYLKNAFKKTIPLLIENAGIDFVSGAIVMMKENQKDFSLPEKQSCRISSPLAYLLGEVSIPLQAAFIRRSAYDRVGGFRIETEQCSDVDLLFRLLHFYKGLIIPEYISVFQIQSEQITQSNPQKWITTLRLMIESCEKDEKYFNVFKLSETLKNEFYLKNKMFWNNYAGSLEDQKIAISTARQILAQKEKYSEALVSFAKSLITGPNQNIFKKIALSVIEGSFINKVKKSLLLRIDKLSIDVNWWQK